LIECCHGTPCVASTFDAGKQVNQGRNVHLIGRSRGEAGIGLVGLLLVLLIMGGLVAIVLTQIDQRPQSVHLTNPLTGSTLSASPSGAGADISAAQEAACRTNYEAVSQAADIYTTTHGRPPSAISELAGMFRDPTSGPGFTIGVNAAGQVTVATPGRPAAPGSGNCAYAAP
jgi:hypothetical protein